MKNILIISSVALGVFFITNDATAQNVLDGTYIREHAPTRRVTPYAHLREADVFWSKRIWRVIDLKEKMNLPLAYPKSSSPIKDRKNLFDIVHDAAIEGSITTYKPYDGLREDDEFVVALTKEEVSKVGGGDPDTVGYEDPVTGEWVEQIIVNELDRDDVIKWKLKEEWFFDKQRSVLECRIIGIAPITELFTETGDYAGDVTLYWVYFPELRNILVNEIAFNRHNDSERRTFDDIFHKRTFSSFIVKETNVYDRRIKDYAVGMDALLEAERIKNEIFLMEHDLWEY